MLRVGCGSSVEYLPHVATMLHSVALHAQPLPIEVHYLHGPELADGDRDALKGMVEGLGGTLVLHEIAESDLSGLPDMPEIPVTMWYRTYLPELLDDVDRILYLDADVIAVDGLAELWATDLGDDVMAAVTNVWEPWNEGYPASLGLRRPYFNSGVLLMDLAGLRAAEATRAVLEYGRASGGLPWGDQDALNVVLGERTLALHPRWNVMNSIRTFPQARTVFGRRQVWQARRRPALLHFEGPAANKPWHADCDHASRQLYARHRRQTPWPEFELLRGAPK